MLKSILGAALFVAMAGLDPQAPAALVARANAVQEIPIPPQAGAIPLRPPAGAADSEQWAIETSGGRSVRNVADPTVTPFLPERGKSTGAAVIIAPGGGFYALMMDDEGYTIARWFADRGVAAFVLKYRPDPTPRDRRGYITTSVTRVISIAKGEHFETPPQALEDAEAAVRLVRARAQAWGVDPARVGFLGFSAGAITALGVGLTTAKDARPDFIAPIYGPMYARAVPPDAPPMFIAIALDDPIFTTGKPLELVESWRAARRPVEAHLYGLGGHGFGSGTSAATKLWAGEFYAWMQDRGLLRPSP